MSPFLRKLLSWSVCALLAAAAAGQPFVLTNGMHPAAVHKPYQAQLTGAEMPARSSWTISKGSLPAGLKLDGKTGQITGSPTQAGEFSFTASVVQGKQPVAAKDFQLHVSAEPEDPYGGISGHPCERGPQPHFYTEREGKRWHLCTPAGNVFWINGIYHVDASDSGKDDQGIALSDVVSAKYARGLTSNSTLNWALQSVRRMESWGFNTLAEYANAWTLPVAVNPDWGTQDQTIPVKLAFVDFSAPSLYSMTNSGHYADGPVKDLVAGIHADVYKGYRSQSVDFWDPKFEQWFKTSLHEDHWLYQSFTGPHKEYLIGMVVDDTDNLQGFGAGPDFPTVSNGVIARGYDQAHLGWMVLVTAPEQTANPKLGVTYGDKTVYAKREFGNWLAARYSGKIARLNAAWRSKYTTFGSAGGWGVGSGVLDEDGTCPAGKNGPCWVPSDSSRLRGATPEMQHDLDAFLEHHAEKYFSIIKSALASAAPGILYTGPTVLGTWSSPPRRQILQAASRYLDLVNLATIPPVCSDCTDIQQREDFVAAFLGDKPWISWEGYQAPRDSYMSRASAKTDLLRTQSARGQLYQRRMEQLLESHDTATGVHHMVGLKWWEFYDNRGEVANWGLLTRRDDPYDGISATLNPGADSWGYPTGCVAHFGCEQQAYGDFIGPVRQANLKVFEVMGAKAAGVR